MFLDFALRYDDQVGDVAFKCFCEFNSKTAKVMDIPRDIYKQFAISGCANQLPSVHVDEFFTEIFFPNITSEFWKTKEELRDSLVIYAIQTAPNSNEIAEALKQYECIPTHPHGRLRRPCDLIGNSTGSLLQDLFLEEDERFIQNDAFDSQTMMENLKALGMNAQTIPNDFVHERAQSIGILTCGQRRMERCIALLKYLKRYGTEDIHLEKIPFLPMLSKPSDWPLHWFKSNDLSEEYDIASSAESELACPNDLTFEADRYLVGCVAPVLDEKSLDQNFRSVLMELGVKETTHISHHKVLGQLEQISKAIISTCNTREIECLKTICKKTYSFLGKHWINNPENPQENLNDMTIIFVEDAMVVPGRCLMKLPKQCFCHPELFDVGKHWDLNQDNLATFFTTVGIRTLSNDEDSSSFGKDCVLDIMIKYENRLEQTVDDSLASLMINLLLLLYELTEGKLDRSEIEKVLVPDSESVLRRPRDICVEDNYDRLSEEPDLHTVHKTMTVALNQMLEIRTKRAKYMSRFDLGIPFGQREDLITRLKGILEDNPSTTTVFNELLQNADDANASRIHYVLDKRNHGTKYILEDTMTETQGPALCVFNDSAFSNDDLEGISRLGQGSKKHDFAKIGQFGIGFNAVYGPDGCAFYTHKRARNSKWWNFHCS